MRKNTCFFSDDDPCEILKRIGDKLKESEQVYQVSDFTKKMKLTYTISKELMEQKMQAENGVEETKEGAGDPSFIEEAQIQVEILDAGDDKVCVEI